MFLEFYQAIKLIPKGKVASFQKLTYMIANGIMTISRVQVALKAHPNPEMSNLHRIVCADGGLSLSYPLGGIEGQK